MIQEKNGFTLLEVVCALMIAAVFSTMLVFAGRKMICSAQMAKERVQAKSLWTAMRLYLMENHVQGNLRSYMLLEELGEESPSAMENPLHQYLQGDVSGNAMIESLTVSKDYSDVTEITYQTDRWTVTVTDDAIVIKPQDEF